MEKRTFAQFLAEKGAFTTGFSGSSSIKGMAKVVNPAKPKKPFDGFGVAHNFFKDGPARSAPGVIGKI